MTAPTLAFSMGKFHKLYVGNNATAATDVAFTRLINENDITLSYKADNENVMTKDGGKVTIPNGDETYTLKGSADVIFTDPALATLLGARNQAWPYQIRDMSVPASPTVFAEGIFVLTDMEFKMSEKGARQVSFTLENAGPVTLDVANGNRAVATS